MLAATPNHTSSGLIPQCSTATIDHDIITLMLRPSALSVPTLMGYFYALSDILRAPHTMRRVDVVLVATPNLASSGLIRRCSTATIDNESMALMQCPSALSAPTLMGYLYAYNSILRAPHTMRRAPTLKWAFFCQMRFCRCYVRLGGEMVTFIYLHYHLAVASLLQC